MTSPFGRHATGARSEDSAAGEQALGQHRAAAGGSPIPSGMRRVNWPNLRLDDLFDQGFRAAIFAPEIEGEVALVVDVMLPTERLVDAMRLRGMPC
jgi:hypothetical protein